LDLCWRFGGKNCHHLHVHMHNHNLSGSLCVRTGTRWLSMCTYRNQVALYVFVQEPSGSLCVRTGTKYQKYRQ
jgi:hypothetical protein